MSRWKARASVASITGACVFAAASGAGAAFVGDWWGQHHGPVVIQFVNGPSGSSPATRSHAASVQKVAAQTYAPPEAVSTAYPAEPESTISRAAPAPRASPVTPHRAITPGGTMRRTASASAPATTAATPSATPSTIPTATATPAPPDPPSFWSPPSSMSPLR